MKRSMFFTTRNAGKKRAKTSSTQQASQRRNKSRFVPCPLCSQSFSFHVIEAHASACDGVKNNWKHGTVDVENKSSSSGFGSVPDCTASKGPSIAKKASTVLVHDNSSSGDHSPGHEQHPNSSKQDDAKLQWASMIKSVQGNCSVPGLFLFEEFITEEEEHELINHLDGIDRKHHNNKQSFLPPWKPSTFNGRHMGKRWGVHCSLKDRKVYPAENPLPQPIQNIIQKITNHPRMKHSIMKGCTPNEANAIDYRRANGDYLKSHVDDRQLSKEPIANLSLAGDCLMTFKNERKQNQKILLKKRTLQILTGGARYDYSHGIDNEDLLSDRRISITMRESPITK